MSVPEGSVRDVLAANLKRVRARRGLSLSELSRRSKIGKATLSQLEAGAGNPTIETVFSLARVLGVPISDLVDGGRAGGLTVVRAAEVPVLSGKGVDLRPLHRIETADSVVEIYDQTVRGDAAQESSGHGGDEHTVVQSGRLGVEVDGQEVEIGPGDYVGFDASLPHRYTALSGPVRSVLLLHHRSEPNIVRFAERQSDGADVHTSG